MRTYKILVRVDGSDRIGMGHVVRCVSLTRELSRLASVEPLFVMKAFPDGTQWVERQRYAVAILPPGSSPEADVSRIRTLLQDERPDAVIADLRELTPGLMETVKAHEVLGVTIDEWGGRNILSDILTNGTIVPSWHQYQLEGDVRCYIGPPYALLDQQFAQRHGRERVARSREPRILIALGGDDPLLLTVKAMRALELISAPLAPTVVIGPAFTNRSEIREMAAQSRHAYEVYEQASNMAELMARSDVAMTGGGLVALELACLGTPGLILCEVPHQLQTAAVLAQHGAAVDLGFGVAVSEREVMRVMSELLEDEPRRNAMAQAGLQLIDGKGCSRVAEAILSALSERDISHDTVPATHSLGR